MDHQFARDLLQRWFDLRAAKTTTLAPSIYREPTVNYTDPQRLHDESQALFEGAAQVAGLSCDLASAGDYFTVNLGRVPVLVVRAEDGSVRAFLNACRHRGSPVAQGRGNPGRVFTCPYHAWAYDVSGRLLGQPSARDAFAEVDRERTGLIALPCREEAGLIYVRPVADGEPIDVKKELEGLAPEIANFDIASFFFYGERTSTWTMNWKQPFDSFLEAYHIFALHRETLALEVLSTPMLTDEFGRHARGVIGSRAALKLLEKDESEWTMRNTANLVYWLFPNTILNLPSPGHIELWQFFPVDGDPAKTRVHVRFYTPGPPKSDKQKEFWDRIVDYTMNFVGEDFVQQERIFTSLCSGVLPELIYGRNESALIHFHRTIEQLLDEARTQRASP